ncbi:MAG: TRAP transporter small permease [Christensenellales bacterium]|jgi:TRAP-type C4-dicarboxylate transport system permease small subunit
MRKTLIKATKKTADYLGYVSGLFIIVNMALIVYSVCARIFFKAPIPGLTDLVGFASGISAFFAFAYTQKEKGFISVDLAGEFFPKKLQLILHVLFSIVEIILFALVTYRFFIYGISTFENNNVTWVMYLPYYPVAFIGCLGMGILTITMVAQNIERFFELKKRR